MKKIIGLILVSLNEKTIRIGIKKYNDSQKENKFGENSSIEIFG